METIILLGINYKFTAINLRETISQEALLQTIYTNYFPNVINEFAILSTCNRIEILLVTQDAEKAEKKIRNIFKGVNVYVYRDQTAVSHVYEVVSGLDSMIVGESEILSQVRKTYTLAKEKKTIGPILHQLLKEAIRIGKRVRSETQIGSGITSVAHAAIIVAKKQTTNFSDCHLLVIGAGTIAERVIKHAKQENSIHSITVTNRTTEKAYQLTQLYGITSIQFEDLENTLIDIDIIISATASQDIILSTATIKYIMQKRPTRPLYMIDLAVPRDIEPAVAIIKNVYLYNIDELQKLVESNIMNRVKEVTRVKKIIGEEMNIFWDWYCQRKSIPLLTALQNQAAAIRNAELDRAFHKLAYLQLNDHDKQTISLLAKRIESKLLAKPLRNIKQLSLEQNGKSELDIIKEVFELQSS